MYHPGEVSKLLDIPPSTLRRYSVLVADYLSAGAHKRKRTYNDQDLTVLARVRDLAGQNVPLDQIPLQIAATIDQPGEAQTTTALALPHVLQEFESIRARLVDQDREITDLRRRLAELEEERKIPLWKRLFKRPE